MEQQRRFERFVGLTCVLVVPFLVLQAVLSLAAYGGGLDAFLNGSLVSHGAHAATLLRWATLVDLVGYYLIVLPLLTLLWQRLQPRDPDLSALATLAGLGYVLVGAVGATLLAVVEPRLMTEYVAAGPAQRETISVVFDVVNRGIVAGLWNLLEQLLLAVWLVGSGLLLWRVRRALAVVAFAGGTFALADAAGRIADMSSVSSIGAVGTVLLPIWLAWWGVELLRRPQPWLAGTAGAARETVAAASGVERAA